MERTIYISKGELDEASRSEQYDIYRVYGLNEEEGAIAIAENIKDFAKRILEGHQLPKGVDFNGVSVDLNTAELHWNDSILHSYPSDEEGNENS